MTNIVLNYEKKEVGDENILSTFGTDASETAELVRKFSESEFIETASFINSLVENGEITGGQLMAMAALGFQNTLNKLQGPMGGLMGMLSKMREQGGEV